MSIHLREILRVVCMTGLIACCTGPVWAQNVVISEFMAANGDTLRDADGNSSDWIELVNFGSTTVDLSGWTLTDDSTELDRWPLPAIELPPSGFLVVFASGKDRRDPLEELHTNFRLSSGGEFLALVDPSGVPVSLFAPEYPAQAVDVSYGAPTTSSVTELVSIEDPVRLLVTRVASDLDNDWNLFEFNDSGWQEAIAAVGFDHKSAPTYEGLFTTDTGELMAGKNASVFVRVSFTVEDPATVSALQISARYDSGFVAYINGVEVGRRNANQTRPNSSATQSRSAEEAAVPENVPLQLPAGLLRAGDNVLAVQAMNDSTASQDFLFAPRLESIRVESVDTDNPRFFTASTVGLPNPPNGRLNLDEINFRPTLEPAGGEFEGTVEVQILASSAFVGALRYTLDGTAPTADSALYERPLRIEENTVLRAALLRDGEVVGGVATGSYFVDAEQYDLPILSFGMEPALFREVHGDSGSGRAAERESHVAVIDRDGNLGASTGMGLRLHGGRGRGGDFETQKSYRMYFRGLYGDRTLEYPLLEETELESFDKIVLRAGFNDSTRGTRGTLIRDQLVRDLHADMGSLISHGGFYNLFVNTEYRGVYNVVERMDESFLASYFPDEPNWYVIKTGNEVLDGGEEADAAFRGLRDFFFENDLTDDAVYEQSLEMLDVENYTSYIMVNVWASNTDWPQNNWYVAKPAREGGKWIFLVWDAEFGFPDQGAESTDTFDRILRENALVQLPFSGLIKNPRYQRYYLEELERHRKGALSSENVLARMDRVAALVRQDIAEQASLPEPNGQFELEVWEDAVVGMQEFARPRGPIIRDFTFSSRAFEIPRTTSVSPDNVMASGPVDVRLNGFDFSDQTVVFFNQVPSPEVRWIDENTLEVRVPFDMSLVGEPEITVEEPDGTGMTSRGLLQLSFVKGEGQSFVRGDANADGSLNILDILKTLDFLFGRDDSSCVDALDIDDSGRVNISDPIFLLDFLFRDSPSAPPPPFPDCGADPSSDAVSCAVPAC